MVYNFHKIKSEVRIITLNPLFPKPPPSITRRHKVFVSYHHALDQSFANFIRDFYSTDDTLIDRSLDDEIESDDDDYILARIRTEHLKESTVTIVLIGSKTWTRKWVDWEVYSSLRPYGNIRTINGLLGITLPTVTFLPPRFADNYYQINTPYGIRQIGYARLIDWNDIATPSIPIRGLYESDISFRRRVNSWRTEYYRRRYKLITMIDEAFKNRNKRILINNTLPRFVIDLPC